MELARSRPVMQSLLRALFAALVVQAAYWLVFDPIFHRNKSPDSIAEFAEVDYAVLSGADEQAWAAGRFAKKELPIEDCCDAGYRGIRAHFRLDTVPPHPLGIIMRMGGDNFSLKINGTTIYQEGSLNAEHLTYHGNVRRVFRVPESALKAGDNEIAVVLVRDKGIPYFDFLPPVIGDYKALSAARAGEYFTLNTLSTVSIALGTLLTFLLTIVVLRGGNNAILRWFLVIVGGWTLHLLYYELSNPPIHGIARVIYLYTFVNLVPLAWLNLANHWSSKPLRWLGAVSCAAYGLLMVANWAILTFGLMQKIDTVDTISLAFGLVMSLGAVVLFVRGVLRNYDQRHWETAMFILCLTLIGTDSCLTLFGETTARYADQGMPFLIVGLAAAFLARNVRLFQSAESLRTMLQSQLTARTTELEAAHARETVMVREKAHQHERQRIMRDMHDGLGSQLMSMLLMAKRGKAEPQTVADGLQTVIDEMRLMIDSMDSVGESLEAALTVFRERMQARVEGAGRAFVWSEAEGLALPVYGPRTILQVFRVMQEAVANALKHSSGDTIAIAVTAPADPAHALRIIIADNGEGMGATNPRGRGMANMEGRARSIGAGLVIADGGLDGQTRGVRVQLNLPLADMRDGDEA